jgi:cephalosporin hydroxylase
MVESRRVKLTIDTDAGTLTEDSDGVVSSWPLYSKEAFERISRQWLKVGWNERYVYTFTWFGRPIIQLPEDLLRTQEVVYRVKPDLLVETGVAHGGSLVFYASLLKAMGRGRVVGIDVDIRAPNRRALESHELFPAITLIQGDSTAPDVVRQVEGLVRPGDTVMVVLDSKHTKAHVLAELEAYHRLVTPGSYIVATDGSMQDLHDVPRGQAEWRWDHPSAAAVEFAGSHQDFVLEQPPWPFNESQLDANVTHWPHAWLRRV